MTKPLAHTEGGQAFRFVVAALLGAFFGLATANPSTTLSTVFFVGAAVAGLIAASHTATELTGPDRLGGIGANLAATGATVFGAAAVQSVGPGWPGLSIVVAPLGGLAAVWWLAHDRYDDNPRWLVSLIGAGFGGFFGFTSVLIAALNQRDEVTAIHRVGFAVAGLALFASTAITVVGAVGFLRAARSGP